mgnify:CR=1 FL=1
MSASEYLPLYQSFTNRTHIRKGHWFDHSEISQIIEKNICCGVILSGLIQLKSIPRTEYIVLPYNTRASTLWTPFRGWILSCQKGVAFHAPSEAWLKEGVSIWNPLETLSRLSLLRSWQTADFHNAAQIICNNITCLRDTTLNGGQTDHCWKWVETFSVSFAAWGVLETPYPVLSGTLPLPQVAMVKNVHRA